MAGPDRDLTGPGRTGLYINLVGSPKKITDIFVSLTKEFEMKDLGQTKFYLGLLIEHLEDRILLH